MVTYFYRYEGNNLISRGAKKRKHNLRLIIGVVVGVVVVLCGAIVCIVMVCRRRKPHAIPTSNKEVAVQSKENPSQIHANQAYQPHAHANSMSEPYPNGQNQENSFSFFLLGSYKHTSEA